MVRAGMEVRKFHPLPVFLPQHALCRHAFARAGVAFRGPSAATALASSLLAAPPFIGCSHPPVRAVGGSVPVISVLFAAMRLV